MSALHELKNNSGIKRKVQRVGRGPGSGRGKTSCRGQKGDGARSGYRRRFGYEGGQVPLYRKLPCRGFTRGRFAREHIALNLNQISELFENGETVNFATLREKGCAPHRLPGGIKILSTGELTKNVTIEANRFSKQAIEKLEKKKISYKIL